jgi:hypothetical protein
MTKAGRALLSNLDGYDGIHPRLDILDIEKQAAAAARAQVDLLQLEVNALRNRNAALSAESEALLSLLRGMDFVFECHCDPIWTDRHLHAPNCHWDEGGEEVLAALAARDGAPRT